MSLQSMGSGRIESSFSEMSISSTGSGFGSGSGIGLSTDMDSFSTKVKGLFCTLLYLCINIYNIYDLQITSICVTLYQASVASTGIFGESICVLFRVDKMLVRV